MASTSPMASLRPPCPSCEAAGPAKFCDYKFAGEFLQLPQQDKAINTYVSRPKSKPKTGIIVFTDIFGNKSPQVQFVSDELARAGYLLCVPDFFTSTFGRAWDFSDMPPKDPEEFKRYFAAINDLPAITSIAAVAGRWLREQGVESVGCAGFCWGGAMVLRVAGEPSKSLGLSCVASVHPALTATTQEDYDAIRIPVLFCPSKGEKQEHIDQVNAALQRHPQKDKCQFRFFDVPHGYCATRGDWANKPEERDAATATIELMGKFFTSAL